MQARGAYFMPTACTLNDMFNQSIERAPRSTAIKFYPDAKLPYAYEISYRKLAVKAWLFASGLYQLGVRKGDRVAFMLPNCPQAVIVYFAILKLGAIVVQFVPNPEGKPEDIQRQLDDCGAQFFITLDIFKENIEKMQRQPAVLILGSILDYLPFPFNVIKKMQNPPRYAVNYRVHQPFSFLEVMKWRKEFLNTVFPEVKPDDPAVLQYTSGTMGTPKGAVLTHANLVANVEQLQEWVRDARYAEEVIMTMIPLFHSFAMTVCQNFAVKINAAMILIPKPADIATVAKALRKYKPTLFPGIPDLFDVISAYSEKKEKINLSGVRCFSGSTALSRKILERFEKATDGVIFEAYGLTEASPATHCNPLDVRQRKIGSIGYLLPGTQALIVDSEGNVLPDGERGELIIRGPQIMRAYWQNQEKTDHIMREYHGKKWLFTGDEAKQDDQGFFYIFGRIDDGFKVGGEKVCPQEVEEVLFQHPDIASSCVVNGKDKSGLDYCAAFIVCKETTIPYDELKLSIREFCVERLDRRKIPTKIFFVPELPKTVIKKLDRKVLRAQLAQTPS
ncbi:MAG: AMP-binding protein [bacterium]|nr:AMP-binding protein [bacterium]